MTDRSIVNQGFYLQKEATAGTPLTDAMRRYHGLRVRPGWAVETQEFRAEGFKTQTATQVLSEHGAHTVETIQDFNAMLPILASVLNYDGVTATTPVGGYEHTFSLTSDGPDDLTTFTGIYGDSAQALELANADGGELNDPRGIKRWRSGTAASSMRSRGACRSRAGCSRCLRRSTTASRSARAAISTFRSRFGISIIMPAGRS